MFSDNVEVDHLVGWTNGDWIVRLLVLYAWPLGIAVLAVAVAGAALLALSRVHNLFAEILSGLIALGVFAPALIWGVYRTSPSPSRCSATPPAGSGHSHWRSASACSGR